MATLPQAENIYQSAENVRRTGDEVHALEILDENLFVGLLWLERKRSQRTNQPFALLVLDGGPLFHRTSSVLATVVSTISGSTRQTDPLGWYKPGRQLAVLFTEIRSTDAAALRKIVEKLTVVLQQALSIEEFKRLNITFRVFPEHVTGESPERQIAFFYPDFSDRPLSKRCALALKRIIDVVGSLLALIVLAPVMGIVALLVKLSSRGPVLFRQERLGKHEKPFTFLKFRSMYVDNDPKVHQEYVARLIAGDEAVTQTSGTANGTYKLTNDARVTRVGKLLRKTSLDELPQLFNVLRGDMSLVGPRPPLPYEVERYHIWHRARVLEIKPGITGLWQVNGRSRTTFDDMVRLDLRYAKSWSLWLDLKILLQTPRAVISGEGAY